LEEYRLQKKTFTLRNNHSSITDINYRFSMFLWLSIISNYTLFYQLIYMWTGTIL